MLCCILIKILHRTIPKLRHLGLSIVIIIWLTTRYQRISINWLRFRKHSSQIKFLNWWRIAICYIKIIDRIILLKLCVLIILVCLVALREILIIHEVLILVSRHFFLLSYWIQRSLVRILKIGRLNGIMQWLASLNRKLVLIIYISKLANCILVWDLSTSSDLNRLSDTSCVF